jgi:predicted outer membrane protein
LSPLFGGAGEATSTQQFRAEAVRGDAFEIESSRMALERSRDPHVRAFARRMIQDHSQTTAALLPPGAALNASGNVVPENDPGLFAGGPLGILVAPLTVPVNVIGGTLGGQNVLAEQPAQAKRIAIDPRRAAMLQDLAATPGRRAFTAKYAQQQVMAHQEMVALYSSEAQNGDDDDARSFAGQALPVLQDHLGHAVSLDERVGAPSQPAF